MSKKFNILFLTILAVVILVIGIALLFMGFNNSFYSDNVLLQMVFNFITQLGDELVFVVLLAVVFFTADVSFSKPLLLFFLISQYSIAFMKNTFKDARPLTNINKETGMPIEDSYAFPSGHTQKSIVFWGYPLFCNKPGKRNAAIRIIAIAAMILVPISRLIIGVHDLQDVVGGLVMGFSFLILYILLEPIIVKFKLLEIRKRILIGVIVSLGLWLLTFTAGLEAVKDAGVSCGLLLACSICFPLGEKYIKYNPGKLSPGKKALSGLIGLVITFAFYSGLGAIFELFTEDFQYIWQLLRYILFGFIFCMGIPALLKKLLWRD